MSKSVDKQDYNINKTANKSVDKTQDSSNLQNDFKIEINILSILNKLERKILIIEKNILQLEFDIKRIHSDIENITNREFEDPFTSDRECNSLFHSQCLSG